MIFRWFIIYLYIILYTVYTFIAIYDLFSEWIKPNRFTMVKYGYFSLKTLSRRTSAENAFKLSAIPIEYFALFINTKKSLRLNKSYRK